MYTNWFFAVALCKLAIVHVHLTLSMMFEISSKTESSTHFRYYAAQAHHAKLFLDHIIEVM